MGLIGYTTDEVRRRSKEIAIRKVNGSEATGILELLVKDVLYVAVVAVLIGVVMASMVLSMVCGWICLPNMFRSVGLPIF